MMILQYVLFLAVLFVKLIVLTDMCTTGRVSANERSFLDVSCPSFCTFFNPIVL